MNIDITSQLLIVTESGELKKKTLFDIEGQQQKNWSR